MNHWNHWERQLRSWTPRGPSKRIQKELFERAFIPEEAVRFDATWRWLAPALGCLLVIASISNPGRGRVGYGPDFGTNYLQRDLGRGVGNPAYLMANFHSKQNLAGRETFEWTKEPAPRSSMGSFSRPETNSLIY